MRLTRQPISVDGHVSLPRGTCGHRQPGTQGRISSKGQLDNPDGLTQFGDTKTLLMFRTKTYFTGEYPWHAAILKREEFDNLYICGGSLIDSHHIVTAAHCIDKYSKEQIRFESTIL